MLLNITKRLLGYGMLGSAVSGYMVKLIRSTSEGGELLELPFVLLEIPDIK